MNKYIALLMVVALIILFYWLCTVTVMQGTTAVILSFGKPVKVIDQPGLYLKLPYPFHKVHKIDRRLRMLEPKPAEFLTADKKNLILENAICYRISQPVKFMNTVRDLNGLQIRLTDIMSSHTGLLLGHRELSQLVNVDTSKIKFQEMNQELTELMRKDAQEFGVDIEMVFIKRLMLPAQNKLAVYDRMRAERERIARKYLAEGEEQAMGIRAEAEQISRRLIAEAKKEAAISKGKADAQAMKIYGEAFSQNLEFYEFMRSLEAYRKLFNVKTTIVLDEKSPLLKTLNSGGEIGR